MIGWLQISSGRGPEECRWVVFQLVQYLIDSVEKYGWRAELVEAMPGDVARTYKSALLSVEGKSGVDGFIAQWQGSVKWIGKSMFRPHHKRRNWFVSITAIEPVVSARWHAADIRVDRMRSSGPGGQHVNKTESAIRVTHLPTGMSAISQEERSQHRNRTLAMARLQTLLRNKAEQARMEQDRIRWQHHNCIERGNAANVFKGRQFRPQP